MTYIDALNSFYDLIQCNQVSANAQLLYYTLLQINNKCSWMDWFQRTNVSLCGIMNMGEKAMMNARNELKQLGLIAFETSKKRGECTKYSILYPSNGSTNAAQTQYKRSTNAVQTADINRQRQRQRQKSNTNVLPENFSDHPVLDQEIKNFIAFRKTMKKPMSQHAIELLIKHLNQMSSDPEVQIRILEQSIERGWTGIFPLKETTQVSKETNEDLLRRWASE